MLPNDLVDLTELISAIHYVLSTQCEELLLAVLMEWAPWFFSSTRRKTLRTLHIH